LEVLGWLEARRAQFGKTRMRAMKCGQNGLLSNGMPGHRPPFSDYVIDPALENIFCAMAEIEQRGMFDRAHSAMIRS
jgi:hypothetical protein